MTRVAVIYADRGDAAKAVPLELYNGYAIKSQDREMSMDLVLFDGHLPDLCRPKGNLNWVASAVAFEVMTRTTVISTTQMKIADGSILPPFLKSKADSIASPESTGRYFELFLPIFKQLPTNQKIHWRTLAKLSPPERVRMLKMECLKHFAWRGHKIISFGDGLAMPITVANDLFPLVRHYLDYTEV